MAKHFAALGYQDVVHIAGPTDNFDAIERARGFHAAARQLGLVVERDIPGDYSEEAGRAAGLRIAKRAKLPRAIFAANDNMAVGCLEVLIAADINVPHDIAVAGFDDIPIARFTAPPLTTVRPPVAQQGVEAFEWLVAAINRKERSPLPPGPHAQALPTRLVVRGSTVANRAPERARKGVRSRSQ